MSEPENFVSRWSRLKRETAKPTSAEPVLPSRPQGGGVQGTQAGPAAPSPGLNAPAAPKVDLASLPSIESITAGSDIRSFLQSGVPAELTKAALRRAWTADPAIRDFVGIAENQWDFTDPTAMPGFGPLEATDDVRQLVSQAMGRWGTASERVAEGLAFETPVASGQVSPPREAAAKPSLQAPGMPGGIRSEAKAVNSSPEQNEVNAAPQQGAEPAENEASPNRRVHGTALPQ
jgi:Protein of unknown function (DUF3306)